MGVWARLVGSTVFGISIIIHLVTGHPAHYMPTLEMILKFRKLQACICRLANAIVTTAERGRVIQKTGLVAMLSPDDKA